ncbi:metal-dependent hydrolase [Leptolyngbya sp. BL0902]|uniref:M48 family metallopeptidase n=1 Tax=Leptolyngbya sp. BL0902 TaxID=1115757 RepID=UPI0018E8454C|nr:SprT family zinc-dependent metalloprotease [Leptolyngbya sp. BL0902]QQE65859.1 metal-dependent hydrolase [Leptolyngbya sp. BL0902]
MTESSQQLELLERTPPGLPAYRVRESRRARHVSIKVHLNGDIEVVIPPGFDVAQVPDILHKRREWLWQTVRQVEYKTAQLDEEHFEPKPNQVDLRSRQQTWDVLYQAGPSQRLTLTQPRPFTLMLRGHVDDDTACTDLLRQWLTRKARAEFAPWLRELSFDVGLPFNKVSIRGQKTRWASCSTHKDISLNYKLLFLPPELVHYVFVHELCHTIHMNHSNAFWRLVGEKQADYQRHRDHIRDGWRYVPRWVES